MDWNSHVTTQFETCCLISCNLFFRSLFGPFFLFISHSLALSLSFSLDLSLSFSISFSRTLNSIANSKCFVRNPMINEWLDLCIYFSELFQTNKKTMFCFENLATKFDFCRYCEIEKSGLGTWKKQSQNIWVASWWRLCAFESYVQWNAMYAVEWRH